MKKLSWDFNLLFTLALIVFPAQNVFGADFAVSEEVSSEQQMIPTKSPNIPPQDLQDTIALNEGLEPSMTEWLQPNNPLSNSSSQLAAENNGGNEKKESAKIRENTENPELSNTTTTTSENSPATSTSGSSEGNAATGNPMVDDLFNSLNLPDLPPEEMIDILEIDLVGNANVIAAALAEWANSILPAIQDGGDLAAIQDEITGFINAAGYLNQFESFLNQAESLFEGTQFPDSILTDTILDRISSLRGILADLRAIIVGSYEEFYTFIQNQYDSMSDQIEAIYPCAADVNKCGGDTDTDDEKSKKRSEVLTRIGELLAQAEAFEIKLSRLYNFFDINRVAEWVSTSGSEDEFVYDQDYLTSLETISRNNIGKEEGAIASIDRLLYLILACYRRYENQRYFVSLSTHQAVI